ncbi:MAG: hypothetical protein M1837_003747 [Sclerophora amabilis]|nr:MAG: hypothetical protein M1837_003747 [Sclerophora amabilis]
MTLRSGQPAREVKSGRPDVVGNIPFTLGSLVQPGPAISLAVDVLMPEDVLAGDQLWLALACTIADVDLVGISPTCVQVSQIIHGPVLKLFRLVVSRSNPHVESTYADPVIFLTHDLRLTTLTGESCTFVAGVGRNRGQGEKEEQECWINVSNAIAEPPHGSPVRNEGESRRLAKAQSILGAFKSCGLDHIGAETLTCLDISQVHGVTAADSRVNDNGRRLAGTQMSFQDLFYIR